MVKILYNNSLSYRVKKVMQFFYDTYSMFATEKVCK